MARKVNMVTRTIDTTIVQVVGLNTSTKEVITADIEVAGSVKDIRLLKMMNEQYAPVDTVYVQASVKEVISKLYGMSESDFIKHAKVLPPRQGVKE